MQRKKFYSGQMSSSEEIVQKSSEVILADLMLVCFLHY